MWTRYHKSLSSRRDKTCIAAREPLFTIAHWVLQRSSTRSWLLSPFDIDLSYARSRRWIMIICKRICKRSLPCYGSVPDPSLHWLRLLPYSQARHFATQADEDTIASMDALCGGLFLHRGIQEAERERIKRQVRLAVKMGGLALGSRSLICGAASIGSWHLTMISMHQEWGSGARPPALSGSQAKPVCRSQ